MSSDWLEKNTESHNELRSSSATLLDPYWNPAARMKFSQASQLGRTCMGRMRMGRTRRMGRMGRMGYSTAVGIDTAVGIPIGIPLTDLHTTEATTGILSSSRWESLSPASHWPERNRSASVSEKSDTEFIRLVRPRTSRGWYGRQGGARATDDGVSAVHGR